MTVTLRQREKGNSISLYLDYYQSGRRRYEYLKLYLSPEGGSQKLSRLQKEENKRTLLLAEAIRAKRQVEIQNKKFGFLNHKRKDLSFISFLSSMADKRIDSTGNYGNWLSVLGHLKHYTGGEVSMSEIDADWLEGLKEYLSEAKKDNGKLLQQNTQFSYYSKIVAAIKKAVNEGLIDESPVPMVKAVKAEEVQQEFLTIEELQKAATEECENPELKKAFLFSALTGLRWSDIVNLKWKDISQSRELGFYIRYKQEKTNAVETLPISDEARSLLGEKLGHEDFTFNGLNYSAWNNLKLREWIAKAGINKKITFHCARHTYATLLISQGVDVYVVSKLLGHKNIKNTQVYAKVVDQKKIDAVNKIKLFG